MASLIIGLSLIVASASWAGFILSRTVLDSGRSERLADQMLDNPDVRQALTGRLADALGAQIPPDIPVPRQLLEAGAEQALDDPAVEALIRDGFVQVHQNALAGNSDPVVVDAGALGSSGRNALVAARPELGAFIPPSPVVEVELPSAGLSWLGRVKNFVDRFTLLGAVVASVGAVTAFVVARERAPVLRRVAFWGYGAAAFWLAVGYGIPWVAGILSPTSAAIATAAADVFFGAMIRPAVAMGVFATVLLAAGMVLPFFEHRRGAAVLHPRRRTTDAGSGVGGVAPYSAGGAAIPGAGGAAIPGAGGAAIPAGGGGGFAAGGSMPPSAHRGWQPPARVDNTNPMPIPGTQRVDQPLVDHRVVGGGQSGWGREVGVDISFVEQASPAPVWREGYGYVDPNADPSAGEADEPGPRAG